MDLVFMKGNILSAVLATFILIKCVELVEKKKLDRHARFFFLLKQNRPHSSCFNNVIPYMQLQPLQHLVIPHKHHYIQQNLTIEPPYVIITPFDSRRHMQSSLILFSNMICFDIFFMFMETFCRRTQKKNQLHERNIFIFVPSIRVRRYCIIYRKKKNLEK